MLQQLHHPVTLIEETKSKNAKIQLYTGTEALQTIKSSSFVRRWEALYEACPWATVFEGPLFVNTWYTCYQHKYLPIVVVGRRGEQLTGLLTMAILIDNSGGKLFIVHAGHGEADCQAWLAETATSDYFITSAIELILEAFPNEDIMLRHLPPGTPFGWAKAKRYWRGKCIVESFERPLIQMGDFSLSKRDRKRVKQLQAKANFEIITDTQTLVHHLDEIGTQYDFRHGAMFNRTPFRKDTSYKKMLITLFERGLLTVSVLKVNDEVIASIAATVGKNKAHLGAIICHSPIYASYSPGIVLFLLTSLYLKEQDYDYFDLTPGGDTYKERLATCHDEVHTLIITNKRTFYYWRRLRNYIQGALARTGVNPLDLKFHLRRKHYLYKQKGFSKLLSIKRAKIKQAHTIYKVEPAGVTLASGQFTVSKNALADLLKYNSTGSALTKWEFLETAMRQLETGFHVYTLADTEKLMCAVWVRPTGTKLLKEPFAALPANATILCKLYCHPTADSNLASFLSAVLSNCSDHSQGQETYFILDNSDTQGTLALQQVGSHIVVSQKTEAVSM